MNRPTVGIFVLTLGLNVLANLFVKLGMRDAGGLGAGVLGHMLRTPWMYAGVGCYGLAFLTYSLLLIRMSLSVAYPMITGGIALGLLAVSALFLGEPITLSKAAGVLLVVGGIGLLAR
jgi:multidrug transporter EmrE-like cation transporter